MQIVTQIVMVVLAVLWLLPALRAVGDRAEMRHCITVSNIWLVGSLVVGALN